MLNSQWGPFYCLANCVATLFWSYLLAGSPICLRLLGSIHSISLQDLNNRTRNQICLIKWQPYNWLSWITSSLSSRANSKSVQFRSSHTYIVMKSQKLQTDVGIIPPLPHSRLSDLHNDGCRSQLYFPTQHPDNCIICMRIVDNDDQGSPIIT